MVIFAFLQISHVGWVKRQRNPTKDIIKISESGGYRVTCTELAEVSRDDIQY